MRRRLPLAALATVLLAAAARAQTEPDPVAAAAMELLQRRCVECHGPQKQKGKLRLDQADGVRSVAQPGDPAASELWGRVTLPADDADVMPPERGLAADEQDLLRRWILAGAAFVVSDAERQRAATEAVLAGLREQTGAVVVELPGDAGGLRVDFGRCSRQLQPDALQALEPCAGTVLELSLAGLQLGAGWRVCVDALPALPRLQRLRLERSDVDDQTLARLLDRTPAVASVNLHSTPLTERSLELLARMPALRQVVLHDTAIDGAARTAFGVARPDVAVVGALPLPDDPFADGGPRCVLVANDRHAACYREVTIDRFTLLWERPAAGAAGVAWRPDGAALLQAPDGELLALAAATGAVLARWRPPATEPLRALTALPWGGVAVMLGGTGWLVELDPEMRIGGIGPLAEAAGAAPATLWAGHDGTLLIATAGTVAEVRGGLRVGAWSSLRPAPIDGVARLPDGRVLLATARGLEERTGDGTRLRLGWDRCGEPTPVRASGLQLLRNGHLVLGLSAEAAPPRLVELDGADRLVWSFQDVDRFAAGALRFAVREDAARR